MNGLSIEVIILRLCVAWAASMALNIAIFIFCSRDSKGSFSHLPATLAFSLSLAFALGAASLVASRSAALLVFKFWGSAHVEIVIAICFVAGTFGLYLGFFMLVFAQYYAAQLAGLPDNQLPLQAYPKRMWSNSKTAKSKPRARQSRSNRRYHTANIFAWPLLAFVVASCLWRDAPSWFLLLNALVIAAATAVAASFKNTDLSEASIKSGVNSSLIMLTGFAPMALLLRALYRYEVIDWQWPLAVAFVIGLPVTILMWWSVGRFRGRLSETIIFGIFCCFAGPGSLIGSLLLFANDIPRPSFISVYRLEVTAKSEEPRRRNSGPTFYIKTVMPSDLKGIRKFKLSASAYQSISVGEDACIRVMHGTLSIRWYQVRKCTPKR